MIMNHTAILLHGVDPMNILITERVTRISIVTIDGRIDAFGVPELRDRLYKQLEDGVSNFVLDLRRVTFLDSAGMAALVNLLKRARSGRWRCQARLPDGGKRQAHPYHDQV